jgi:hypothetical protein
MKHTKQITDRKRFKGRVFLFAHFFIDLHHFTECFQPVGISANGLEHLDVGLNLWAGRERGSGDEEQRNGCRKSTHCVPEKDHPKRPWRTDGCGAR